MPHTLESNCHNMTLEACTSTFILQYEKEAVKVLSRCSEPREFVPLQLLDEKSGTSSTTNASTLSCSSLHPETPVKFPQRPSSGIVNPTVREAMLQEYAKNPLVFTVRWQDNDASSVMSSSSRHFMGFGFSKEVPYFPPGTIIEFVNNSCQNVKTTTKVTGMVAAYGHRNHEYAVILSLDQPVHPDAVSLFLETYNITEIDGGDEGLCTCIATVIRKYTYTIGDVDPACASTDAMESMVSSKFEGEIQRMQECVHMAILTALSYRSSTLEDDDDEEEDHHDSFDSKDSISRGEDFKRRRRMQEKVECIERAFRTYRQTLLLQMRHQPLGTREWMQMFESYMTFAAAEQGLGFIDFVLH